MSTAVTGRTNLLIQILWGLTASLRLAGVCAVEKRGVNSLAKFLNMVIGDDDNIIGIGNCHVMLFNFN